MINEDGRMADYIERLEQERDTCRDAATERFNQMDAALAERDAALAREAVLKGKLAAALNACTAAKHQMEHPTMGGGNYDRAQRILAEAQRTLVAALATPSPAAEALLELAKAAADGLDSADDAGRWLEARGRLLAATRRYQQAREEGQGAD